MAEEKNIWPKNISVDKRIVRILSESTYENFPRALKELITNSYDADARNSLVTIDLHKETITVEDDGKGMGVSDFAFYLRIAGKKREKEENETALGRKIIGQFGVGFLSIFPFFKSYYIESKKAGSSTKLYATIPLFKYFSDENKAMDIEGISINGGEKEVPNEANKSYTRITLTGFNELTKAFFFTQIKSKKDKTKSETNSIKSKSGFEQLKWSLEEDLPLAFKEEKFNKIFGYDSTVPFNVFINDKPLFRSTYGDSILETHRGGFHQIGKIKCKYFIATPNRLIQPTQGRYYKIRNLNVGVGDRDDFGLEHGEGSHSRWIYGEIHIVEGMNNLIKVSRDGLNYNSDYENMMSYFNSKLRHYSTKLSQAATFQREVKQTGREFRVNDVKLLESDALTTKLESFRSDGYQIKRVEENPKKRRPIKIDEEKKEILIEKTAFSFEKHIIINNKKFKVVSDRWDFNSEIFPACKISGSTIILNQSYPLFLKLKYTDVFVKMHLLLAISFENKKIDKKTFSFLANEVLKYYSDYLKK